MVKLPILRGTASRHLPSHGVISRTRSTTFTMTSPVASTLGLWLVTQFLTAMLYGTGLLQAYLYFFWYPKDGWFTKGAVISLVVFETAQTALFFSASYKMFIDGFGQFGPDSIVPWEAKVQLFALTLSTFVAQVYFADMLFLIGNKRIIYPTFVALVAVASFGAGIAQFAILFTLQTWAELVKTSVTLNVESATAFACDLFITVGLCWHLNTSRTRLSRVACQNGLRRLAELKLAVTGLPGLACGLCLLVLGYYIAPHSPLAPSVFMVAFLPSGSTPSPSLIASTMVEPATARLVYPRPNLPPKSYNSVPGTSHYYPEYQLETISHGAA
ncbi:hypothetical protein C8R45DRAFT_1079143 [Mycena sanguinolenta]|nr:hypothetical protein C8R45DRAFT_1079143 [Mycena sanguinolenta]